MQCCCSEDNSQIIYISFNSVYSLDRLEVALTNLLSLFGLCFYYKPQYHSSHIKGFVRNFVRNFNFKWWRSRKFVWLMIWPRRWKVCVQKEWEPTPLLFPGSQPALMHCMLSLGRSLLRERGAYFKFAIHQGASFRYLYLKVPINTSVDTGYALSLWIFFSFSVNQIILLRQIKQKPTRWNQLFQ